MLSFFRINDPYRIIAVALIMLLMRIPFYLFGQVHTEADQLYMLLGEKVAQGNWMYIDIVTEIPPLTGIFYGAIHFIFGKSIVTYHIIGFLLAIIQVFLFNNLVVKNKATHYQTYIPGFVYGMLITLSPELYTLSPILIAMTFVLVALDYHFNHLEFRVKRDEKILSMGIYLGIATMFYNPFILFFLTMLIVFALFTNTILRRYFMLIYGFLLPFLILCVAYLLKGDLSSFLNYTWQYQWYGSEFSTGWQFSILLLLIFLVWAVGVMLSSGRFTNFQSTLNQAMFVWFMFSLVIWFFFNHVTPAILAILITPVSFYVMHHFSIAKKGWRTTVYLLLFFAGIIFTQITFWYPFEDEFLSKSQHFINENPYSEVVANKQIWVLDDTYSYYQGASHSTPFLSFELVKDRFETVNYENLSFINRELGSHNPQIIIDQNELLSPFLEKSPRLKTIYQWNNEGYWERISN